MFTYVTGLKVYVELLPPGGDFPAFTPVEYQSWMNDDKEEVRFYFFKALKKNDTIKVQELNNFFHYKVEVTTASKTIEETASRSIFLVEQVLDTSAFFSQAPGRMTELDYCVNLSQIEEVIKGKKFSYESARFIKRLPDQTKALLPGRLAFLTEKGTKGIGRNLFWFRKGLSELNTLNRFVAFFTALKELDLDFREFNKKDKKFVPNIKEFIERELKFRKGTFKKWSDIRNDIIHFSGRKKDYRKIAQEVRCELKDIYRATYYALAKFFTDNPPIPSDLIIYDDLLIEKIIATPQIVANLTEIKKRRENRKEIVFA